MNKELTESSLLLNCRRKRIRPLRTNWYSNCRIFVTSKAAILTLVWRFAVGTMYQQAYHPLDYIIAVNLPFVFMPVAYAKNAALFLFYPLAGLLADIKFGRFKTITWSLKLLLGFAAVALPGYAFIIICTGCHPSAVVYGTIAVCGLFLLLMNIGFVGFLANVIQFGMDQLHDSPADHQSLFIHWYVWVYYLVGLIFKLPYELVFAFKSKQVIPSIIRWFIGLTYLLNFLLLLVSLLIGSRRKQWFLINQTKLNPYKMVYRVSKFAWQHKVPVRRSAFTYCEDELPTGLDLGKSKYGGPFSTEEVENVKAFYGILKVLFALGPVYLLIFASDPELYWYAKRIYYLPIHPVDAYDNVTQGVFEAGNLKMSFLLREDIFVSLLIVGMIPIYLFLLRSLLYRFQLVPSMLKRIGIGIVFLVASVVCSFGMNMASHYHQQINITCFFSIHDGTNNQRLESISPLIIQPCLLAISIMFIKIGLYEFICAQSPHSMKGFLIGLKSAIKGVFEMLAAIMVIPFSFIGTPFPTCGMYYYIMNILIGFVALLIYVGVARKYKYRQRDEFCDIYQYAEEYYSNVQP